MKTCKTLAELKVEHIDLYKVFMQNIDSCLLKGKSKDPHMQWSPNIKFIRTSAPDPKPTPLKPNPNPSPSPSMDNLIQEIGKQSSESLQVPLASLQLKANKRGLIPQNLPCKPNSPTPNSSGSDSTPQDKPPNGNPPNNNPPNLPKTNDSILDQDKLGKTKVKANENFVETLTSHGLLKTQTPKISQFRGDELKGDVSFEHWDYGIETLRKGYTESKIKETITKSLKGSAAESLRPLGL